MDDAIRDAAAELLCFWSPVADEGAGPHPKDRLALDAADHRLRLERTPEPWFGDPRHARVFMLTFNPGHTDEPEPDRVGWNRFCIDMLAGRASAGQYWQWAPAGARRWLARTYGSFSLRDDFFDAICNLRLVAYPSQAKADTRGLRHRQLASARAMLGFVHDVLLPRARGGEVALLVMRSPEAWGFGTPREDRTEGGLFVSRPLRNVSISPTSRVGHLVSRFLPGA